MLHFRLGFILILVSCGNGDRGAVKVTDSTETDQDKVADPDGKACTEMGALRLNEINLVSQVFPKNLKVEIDGKVVATHCAYNEDPATSHTSKATSFEFEAPQEEAIEGGEVLERKHVLKLTAYPNECADSDLFGDPIVIQEGEMAFKEVLALPNGEGCGAQWAGMKLELKALAFEFYRRATLIEIGQRIYYQMDSSAVCIRQEGELPVNTWRDEARFESEGVAHIGDICSSGAVNFEEYTMFQYSFNADLSRMSYKGNTYQYYSLPPQICKSDETCKVPERLETE